MVERCVRDAEAGGSNPLTPTMFTLDACLLSTRYVRDRPGRAPDPGPGPDLAEKAR